MIKFTSETLEIMRIFEVIIKVPLKDCLIYKSSITFVVNNGFAGKAIGKGGSKVKNLERALKRKIKIVEFNPQVETFIKNLIAPLKINAINEINEMIIITPTTSQVRGQLIGKNACNLRELESVVKKYFEIKEIKVESKWETKETD